MSNYLTQRIQYSDTLDTSAVDTFSRIATLKQQKFDSAQNQIQNTIDQYGAMAQGLRDKGKEYLAGKLQAVTQLVNESGQNRDLSKSGVTRAINSQITSIVRDPILINEITQSQKIQSFNKEVGKLKEKSPDKYDDGNYQDALNLAGVQQFMNGETNAVGSLSYHEYINLPELLNKNAQEFASKTGQEQYLGTDNYGLYQVNRFGKRVSTNDIQTHLLNSLDGKSMAQMQINARQTLGSTSKEFMTAQLLDENSEKQNILTKAQADLKSMSPEDVAQYAPRIDQLKAEISANNDKIKLGTFSSNDIYSAYTNRLTRNIAGEYDIDVITKFDTDKMPYEMAKDDREYALKLETLNVAKQGRQDKLDIQRNATLGTTTDVIQQNEDKDQSGFTTIRQQTYKSASGLDAYLLKTDPSFTSMNAQERWNYKLNLDAENPKIKGNTAEYRNLVEEFQTNQRQYANIVGTASNGIKTTTTNVFNQMLDGKGTSDLNIKNLSISMPLTATMLNRKDIASFNNLSPAQKIGVMAEFASSNLQFNKDLTGDVRTAYERSVTDLKSKLTGLKTTDSKIVLDTIKNSTDIQEKSTLGVNYIGSLFSGVFSGEKKLIAPVANAIDYGFNRLFQNKEIADKRLTEREKADESVTQDFYKSLENVQEVNSDLYYTDSNIGEIQARDLRAGLDAKQQFNIENQRLDKIIQDKSSIYTKNLSDNKAYSFTTGNKQQAPIAQALEAAILNSSDAPEIPSNNNTYTVQREGTGWRVGYNKDAEKKGKERSSVYVQTLPDAVTNTFNETQQNWKNSPKNPDIKLTPQIFKPETDPLKRNGEVKNISENLNDIMSQQAVVELQTNPSITPFRTTIEFGQQIRQERGNDFWQRNQETINNILNTQYIATPKVTPDPNNPFWVDIHYLDPISGQPSISSQPLKGKEKNNSSFYIQYAKMIYDLKYNSINNLDGQ